MKLPENATATSVIETALHNIGKPELRDKFVALLVDENMLDTVDDLRAITTEQFAAMKVPMKLIVALQALLHDKPATGAATSATPTAAAPAVATPTPTGETPAAEEASDDSANAPDLTEYNPALIRLMEPVGGQELMPFVVKKNVQLSDERTQRRLVFLKKIASFFADSMWNTLKILISAAWRALATRWLARVTW